MGVGPYEDIDISLTEAASIDVHDVRAASVNRDIVLFRDISLGHVIEKERRVTNQYSVWISCRAVLGVFENVTCPKGCKEIKGSCNCTR